MAVEVDSIAASFSSVMLVPHDKGLGHSETRSTGSLPVLLFRKQAGSLCYECLYRLAPTGVQDSSHPTPSFEGPAMKKLPTGCQSYRSLSHVDRRDFLKIGAVGSLGLTLSAALRQDALAEVAASAKAKSVILFWLQGGVSHHDTLDPKPAAPSDIRGPFATINTKVPGIEFTNHMPRMAQISDKLAVIRSVTHAEAAHQRGSIYMVEGRRPPRETGVEHSGNPEIGSIVAHELGMQKGMPPYVSIPGNDFTSKFTGHGWLPAKSAAFRGYESKTLQGGGSGGRFTDRIGFRDALRTATTTGAPQSGWDEFDQRAIEIITSGKGAEAFNIESESDATKELYGLQNSRSDKGKLALTARRLIEAGVRYVTIGRNSWDHHSNIFPQLRNRLPHMDNAIAGLVTDLDQRGMLDETLVIYMTEYGRTPRINKDAGRDHWPQAFSIAFAGAGIKGGQVIGASDKDGAAVTDRPVTPEEVAATILRLVGIHPQTEFIKQDGRPIAYVDRAEPVHELLA